MKQLLIVIVVTLSMSACSLLPKQPVPVAVKQLTLPAPPPGLLAPTLEPNSIQEWQSLKMQYLSESLKPEMKPSQEPSPAKPTLNR